MQSDTNKRKYLTYLNTDFYKRTEEHCPCFPTVYHMYVLVYNFLCYVELSGLISTPEGDVNKRTAYLQPSK